MAITVSGTSITFNDASVQTTAGGAVNTTTVLNATAGASLGAVGTYAFLSNPSASNNTLIAGTTYAGSTLRYAGGLAVGSSASSVSTAPAGTWRAMGYGLSAYDGCTGTNNQYGTVCLRIS